MLIRLIHVALALFLVPACSPSSPLDSMQPGEKGRVVRVIDGDALVLDTGQSVRLVGIEAPVREGRDRPGEPFAEEAARALEDLVMGREVRLYYPGLTRDRYDRALAHVVTADSKGPDYWVNLELVRRGDVRVRLYPDTDGGGETLMAAETAARDAARGLWRLIAYDAISASDTGRDDRGFLIIEGVLDGEALRPQEEVRTILCTRRMRGADLVVDMAFSARPACSTPEGTRVRIRGWTSGHRLELVHPLHLEILD